jgi:hypothetical protein
MDLRLPIGYVFTIYGLMLAIYGFATRGDAMYEKALKTGFDGNVNITWGAVLLIFGVVMLAFAKAGKNKGT